MPRYLEGKRIELAGLGTASQTPDTIAAVRRFENTNAHGTDPVAGPTLCTGIRIKFQPNQTDPVEQAVKSPQFTEGAAKVPKGSNAPEGDEHQYGQLIQIEQEKNQRRLADPVGWGLGYRHVVTGRHTSSY
jgi:hypothetical protein